MLSSSSSSLSSVAFVLSLSLSLAACGGSTAEPPGSEAPSEMATSTGPTTPPPSTPPPTPPSTPPTTPPSTPPSTPPTTPPPTGKCNAIVNNATAVGAAQVAASPPAPTGGAVTNGTYHLVNLTVYTGPGGATGALPLSLKQTIAIHGGTADAISEVSGKSEAVSSTFASSGLTITTAETCPSVGSPRTGTFSATSTSLVFFLVNDLGQTVSYTYAP